MNMPDHTPPLGMTQTAFPAADVQQSIATTEPICTIQATNTKTTKLIIAGKTAIPKWGQMPLFGKILAVRWLDGFVDMDNWYTLCV
jgi:hypothetical protein